MARTDGRNHGTKTTASELSKASRHNMSAGLKVRADVILLTQLGLAWSGTGGVGSGSR